MMPIKFIATLLLFVLFGCGGEFTGDTSGLGGGGGESSSTAHGSTSGDEGGSGGSGSFGPGPGGGGGSTASTGGGGAGPGSGGASTSSSSSTGSGGCMANLNNDPLNCGSCGHSCLGAPCAGGFCVPTLIATEQGVTGVAVTSAAVVWGLADGAGAADLDGNNIRQVPIGVAAPIVAVAGNASHATFLLNSHPSGGQSSVLIFNPAASQLQINQPATDPAAVAMDAARVYWIDQSELNALDTTTLGLTRLALLSLAGRSLSVDGSSVYWTSWASASPSAGELRQASLSGVNQGGSTLLGALHEPCGVLPGTGPIFWSACNDQFPGSLHALAAGGSDSVVTSVAQPALGTDGADVYFADHGELNRKPLAGGSLEKVCKLPTSPGVYVRGLAVGADRVYWGGAGVWWVAK